MDFSNCWKQPIPTNLEVIFREDYKSMQLFKELIYRANRLLDNPVHLEMKRGGTIVLKTVILQPGQVLYGRRKFGQYLGWVDKTVDRYLQKLEKTYHQVSMQRTHNYSVITIQNYDAVTDMSHQVSHKRPSSVHIIEQIEKDKELASMDFLKNEHVDKETIPTFNVDTLNVHPSPILLHVYSKVLPFRKNINNKEAYGKKIAAEISQKLLAVKNILLYPDNDKFKSRAFKARAELGMEPQSGVRPHLDPTWSEADKLWYAVDHSYGWEFLEEEGYI